MNVKVAMVLITSLTCALGVAQVPIGTGNNVSLGGMFLERPPARYGLLEGVKVAIMTVRAKGLDVTPRNVDVEFRNMIKNNDVKAPYSYSVMRVRGSKEKSYLDSDNLKKKAEYEALVTRMCAIANGKDPASVPAQGVSEPIPTQYKTQQGFVNAYVAYKMRFVDDKVRASYAKKIGSSCISVGEQLPHKFI